VRTAAKDSGRVPEVLRAHAPPSPAVGSTAEKPDQAAAELDAMLTGAGLLAAVEAARARRRPCQRRLAGLGRELRRRLAAALARADGDRARESAGGTALAELAALGATLAEHQATEKDMLRAMQAVEDNALSSGRGYAERSQAAALQQGWQQLEHHLAFQAERINYILQFVSGRRVQRVLEAGALDAAKPAASGGAPVPEAQGSAGGKLLDGSAPGTAHGEAPPVAAEPGQLPGSCAEADASSGSGSGGGGGGGRIPTLAAEAQRDEDAAALGMSACGNDPSAQQGGGRAEAAAAQQPAQGADREPQVRPRHAVSARHCMLALHAELGWGLGVQACQGFQGNVLCNVLPLVLHRHADRVGHRPVGTSRAQQGSRRGAAMRRALPLQQRRAARRRGSERAITRAGGRISKMQSTGQQGTWRPWCPCQQP
jgi:hypothetical protein